MTAALINMDVKAQGAYSFPSVCEWVDSFVLTASTAKAVNLATIRTNMGVGSKQGLFVIFGADNPFYANFLATAVIPVSDTNDGSSAQFSPNQRYVDGKYTSLSLIASANTIVTLQFYRP